MVKPKKIITTLCSKLSSFNFTNEHKKEIFWPGVQDGRTISEVQFKVTSFGMSSDFSGLSDIRNVTDCGLGKVIGVKGEMDIVPETMLECRVSMDTSNDVIGSPYMTIN
jgi:hypothetical protein